MIPGFDIKKLAAIVEPLTIGNVPVGLEPLLLAELARAGQPVDYVMSDGQRTWPAPGPSQVPTARQSPATNRVAAAEAPTA